MQLTALSSTTVKQIMILRNPPQTMQIKNPLAQLKNTRVRASDCKIWRQAPSAAKPRLSFI